MTTAFDSNTTAPQEKEPDLSLEQQAAVDMCCDMSLPVVGITGGAGTGKTLVLGRVHRELRANRVSVALAAPTGRAAKRIQELTKIPAKTVHKLLEFPQPDDPKEDGEEPPPNMPRRNRWNRLEEKVVIIDESSMLGPTLYDQLLEALPKDGRLILFGDNNQLRPVEEGLPPFVNVLEEEPHIILTYNFRSGDDMLAHANLILNGRVPKPNKRFTVIYTSDPVRQLTEFVRGSQEFAGAGHQIITPTRQHKYGSTKINPMLQMEFNPHGDLLMLDRFKDNEPQLGVRAGDKFIWVKNDYKLRLWNGDIGVIESVDKEDGTVVVRTDMGPMAVPARLTTYSSYHRSVIRYDPRRQIELGYVVTTHKSQGSEFDTVVYTMSSGQAFLLDRSNFYTAVTRAKNQVVVICDTKAMGLSMRRPKR